VSGFGELSWGLVGVCDDVIIMECAGVRWDGEEEGG